MKNLLFIALIASLAACNGQHSDAHQPQSKNSTQSSTADKICPLTGLWHSDKAKTLNRLKEGLSPSQKKRISTLLGRVSMDFKPDCKSAEIIIDNTAETVNFNVTQQTASPSPTTLG